MDQKIYHSERDINNNQKSTHLINRKSKSLMFTKSIGKSKNSKNTTEHEKTSYLRGRNPGSFLTLPYPIFTLFLSNFVPENHRSNSDAYHELFPLILAGLSKTSRKIIIRHLSAVKNFS